MVVAIGFLLLAFTGCNPLHSNQPTPVSIGEIWPKDTPSITQEIPGTPDSTPTQSEMVTPSSRTTETKPVSDEAPCDGWKIHLVEVETSESDGWKHLKGTLALENVSASFSDIYLAESIRDLLSRNDGLNMTTNEGYSYPKERGAFTLNTWIPPGFKYKSSSWHDAVLEYRVAASSTGHVVNTPCGYFDFDNPETDLTFPTDLPDSDFLPIGTPIELPEGVLTITDFEYYTMEDAENDPDFSGGFVNVTYIYYTFTNASQAYGVENVYIPVIAIDNQGRLSKVEGGGIYLNAGPGQTVERAFVLGISEGRKMMIFRDHDYWIYNLDQDVQVSSSNPTSTPPAATGTAAAFGAPWEACKDAPRSRLQVGYMAYVSHEPPLPNRVRDEPNWNIGEVIGRIYPGEKVRILDGPACHNKVVWWKVESLEKNLTGWTVEGDEEDYWLLPEK